LVGGETSWARSRTYGCENNHRSNNGTLHEVKAMIRKGKTGGNQRGRVNGGRSSKRRENGISHYGTRVQKRGGKRQTREKKKRKHGEKDDVDYLWTTPRGNPEALGCLKNTIKSIGGWDYHEDCIWGAGGYQRYNQSNHRLGS